MANKIIMTSSKLINTYCRPEISLKYFLVKLHYNDLDLLLKPAWRNLQNYNRAPILPGALMCT